MVVLKKIHEFGKRHRIEFTHHARLRMYKREISAEDIRECLLVGRIVENRPNDRPYPSYLLLPFSKINICMLFVHLLKRSYI